MENYIVNSPVLFLIFNRPDVTSLVFDEIKKVKPKRLYIAADGPRENEKNICQETREVIKNIDWDCEVKTLFREENLGCKYGVASAIDWFFDNEEEGIILEDDCLPSQDFFKFCDLMLEKYRFDSRISSITGTNLQNGIKFGNSSYFFTKHTCVWGWAGWRRVWKNYDVELSNIDLEEGKEAFLSIFDNKLISEPWQNIFESLKNNEIDTWDYQYSILNFFNNNLSVVPNVNLISNIGFNQNATHTFDDNTLRSKIPFQSLDSVLVHPKIIVANNKADYSIFNEDFAIEDKLKLISQQNTKKLTFYKKIKAIITNKDIYECKKVIYCND
jgi:hypothetical protein